MGNKHGDGLNAGPSDGEADKAALKFIAKTKVKVAKHEKEAKVKGHESGKAALLKTLASSRNTPDRGDDHAEAPDTSPPVATVRVCRKLEQTASKAFDQMNSWHGSPEPQAWSM